MKKIIMRRAKVRYIKQENNYALIFNGKFAADNYISMVLGIDYNDFIETITETYNAKIKPIPYRFCSIYYFTTRKQAKVAVEWLRSLELARNMTE